MIVFYWIYFIIKWHNNHLFKNVLKKRITLKLLIFLVLTDFFETFVQYFFKKTALDKSDFLIKNAFDAFVFLKAMFLSPYIWFAFIFVFLTFIIWSTILSKIDLSVAVPICSFSYILVPLVSIHFLHEQVTLLGWTGIGFILIGVIFVSFTSAKGETIPK